LQKKKKKSHGYGEKTRSRVEVIYFVPGRRTQRRVGLDMREKARGGKPAPFGGFCETGMTANGLVGGGGETVKAKGRKKRRTARRYPSRSNTGTINQGIKG